ncbi:hypothetical protein SB861_57970, partial [Paraburkholderia sp. SIMBA_049]
GFQTVLLLMPTRHNSSAFERLIHCLTAADAVEACFCFRKGGVGQSALSRFAGFLGAARRIPAARLVWRFGYSVCRRAT